MCKFYIIYLTDFMDQEKWWHGLTKINLLETKNLLKTWKKYLHLKILKDNLLD